MKIAENRARDVLSHRRQNREIRGVQSRRENNLVGGCDLLPVCRHQYMYPTERDARRR